MVPFDSGSPFSRQFLKPPKHLHPPSFQAPIPPSGDKEMDRVRMLIQEALERLQEGDIDVAIGALEEALDGATP